MKTLEDIAREAGVSTSTVSRALNGSPLVNVNTAALIRRLAEEGGYQVNRLAQNLATQRSRVIGLVVPDVANPYFPQLIDTIVGEAKRSGYVVVPTLSGIDQADERSCLRLLEEIRAEAIIVVTGRQGFPTVDAAKELRARGSKIVVLGWAEGTDGFDNVHADDPAGMDRLTRHLLNLGHQNIVMVAQRIERGRRDRAVGFQRAMESEGLWDARRLVANIDEADLDRFMADLWESPDRPTAVIGYHDILAAGLMRSVQELGGRVPDDLSVAGFDNLGLAEYVNPRLTTVDLAIAEHASEALRLLLDSLSRPNDDLPPREVVLTPRLIVRESCGRPPSEHRRPTVLR